MTTSRLEAFSDGVIAILITIMVLELKVPHGDDWSALAPLVPVFLSYVLSFAFLGIYWNNHHHMLQVTDRISGPVLWANLHLLFWLSLIPGVVLFLAAVAYMVLQNLLISLHDENSRLRDAVGRDLKGKVSLALYAVAIPLAFVERWIAIAIYVVVALMWLIPDRRIESRVSAES
jgi:uncharacterized membrane protein